jgi:hypothetical protein
MKESVGSMKEISLDTEDGWIVIHFIRRGLKVYRERSFCWSASEIFPYKGVGDIQYLRDPHNALCHGNKVNKMTIL